MSNDSIFLFFSLQLEQLIELFDREQITLEILAEMGHEDLKQVGVSAYGFRHKILKGIAQLRATTGKFERIPFHSPHVASIQLLFILPTEQVWVKHRIQAHF